MNKFQEHNTHTTETKICKILQLVSWKLPLLAHFPIIFGLFRKTDDLLQIFFKYGSGVVPNLFN